jgi:hypothetical protein
MRTVWIATPLDLDKLVVMARKFHGISPFKDFVFSAAGTRRWLKSIMDDDASVIMMTEHGAIGMKIEELPFCMARGLRELFWFTDRPGDGIYLLKEYEKWAMNRGVDFNMVSSIRSDGPNVEKVNRVLSAFGYDCMEYGHIKVN